MKLNLMLDSGAFSAFTQKKEINFDEYCNFILKNEQYINKAINLDVINPEGPEVAAAAGMTNFLKMKDRGIDAMPVFHARESLKWLDQMIEWTGYVGLSGTSLVSPEEDKFWHRLVWNYITDSTGLPIIKTHSFGNTSEYTLLTFPFYSADSTTWMIQGCRAGRIKLDGKSFQLRTKAIKDYNFISEDDTGPKRECWEALMRDLGVDPDRVMNVKINKGTEMAMIRAYMVAAELYNFQPQTESCKRYLKPKSLIERKKQQVGGFVREGPVKIILVTAPSVYFFNFPVILALGIKDILISYYYITTAQKRFWEDKMVPFIEDPKEYFKKDEKCRRFLDKLNEVLLVPVNC